MIINHEMLINKIRDVIGSEKYTYDELFILMRWAFSLKELQHEKLKIEVVEYNPLADWIVWHNDWWEGQEYVDLEGIYTQSELVDILLKEDKDG